jgi:TolA-binding protein
MSQIEPTDLLCRARRDELSADEQRRLSVSLQHSLEVRLMNEVLSEVERESSVRPGDDLLLARISARALGSSGKAPPRTRRRLGMLLVAAAVLLVASLAGAWLGGARIRKAPEPSPPVTPPTAGNASHSMRPRALPVPKPLASELASEPPPIPSSAPPPRANTASSPRAERKSRAVDSNSASQLFARANLLRRRGEGVEAASLYQLLLDLYPSSREVGPTRLALGKYFQAKQPERALAQYRAAARSGGALRAEALWGISEVASSSGERALAEQALTDLLREYPDSPYAEVARSRAAHGVR